MSGSSSARARIRQAALISSQLSLRSPGLCAMRTRFQRPLELLAVEREFEMPLGEALARIAFRRPDPRSHTMTVPRAILAFGNGPLETAVVERMVLDMHRETLFAGNEAGPLATAQLFRTPSSSRRKS